MDVALINLLKPKEILIPLETNIKKKLIKLNNIKAVIFDIYGTLLISGSGDVGSSIESDSTNAFKKAFSILGIDEISNYQINYIKNNFFKLIKEEHNKQKALNFPYPEIDIIEIWQQLLRNTCENVGLKKDNIKAEFIAAAYESAVNPVYPMPNLEKVLCTLKEKKIKTGIISNAQFYTPLIFKTLFKDGLDGLGFNKSLCVFSYIEKRAKPDFLLFQIMEQKLQNFNIKAEECLYVGNDMLKDVYPATKTGYKTALFAGDRRSLKLRKNIPACNYLKSDVILKNLVEIFDCI